MASTEGMASAGSTKRDETTSIENGNRRPRESTNGTELPFLVTHWLQNFDPSASIGDRLLGPSPATSEDRAKQVALERIRKATSELASAFTALGAYGSFSTPALTLSNANSTKQGRRGESLSAPSNRNATFSDVNRRWAASLPPNHLENLVDSAVSSTVAAEEAVAHCAESNLVDAANEAICRQRRNPTAGRTVEDAIDLENEESKQTPIAQLKPSLLHRPTNVDFDFSSKNLQSARVERTGSTDPKKMPALESQVKQLQTKSSHTMRQYLDLKSKFKSQAREMRTLKSSQEFHSKTKATLQQARLAGGASLQTADTEISEEEQNADRVLAQLARKVGDLEKSHASTTLALNSAKKEAYSYFNRTKSCLLNYRDPIRDATIRRPGFGLRDAKNQGILFTLENRRLGLPSRLNSKRALPRMEPSTVKSNCIRNALLESRLSHAVTINAHCHNPVYSVRFDRTGEYCITGADDNLIKVFRTRAKQTVDANGKVALAQGQSQTVRGAVLVCTFRGHASVINEIDVSPDNCFLATASEDGDCRVWGLKDGAPIAIVRGHVGGCNAVSWSRLTPYRLLTAGHDGFARCWDIRLAALKRYGAMLGKRPEYTLPLSEEERASNAERRTVQEQGDDTNDAVNLPPLPERQAEPENNSGMPAPLPAEEAPAPMPHQGPLPPLPPPAPADGDASVAAGGERAEEPAQGANGNENGNINQNIVQPGYFVQNDIMDEGVRLVGKFQHGTITDEQIAGPGTRSGRGKVKVLLFARCPLGGHFATGASDGNCRIWEDLDDPDVETVDARYCKSSFDWMGDVVASKERRRSVRTTNRLLLELKGFMNPTTDLHYSHAGDRILVGSMQDGVLRIWSWDVDPLVGHGNGKQANNDRNLRSIVIKLTNPLQSKASNTAKNSRRRARGGASNKAKILLDMACWTNDDSKIITSQSQPATGTKIEPDSNFIFVWDSKTGHCLLGIAGGHSRATPVILPHPTNSSIFCTGGSDGYVKVWDCETGKCVFSHKNEHQLRYLADAAAPEPCGLLNDGACFPDGTGFVLSDSSGNVLVFDSIVPASEQQSQSGAQSLLPPPIWMKEQYRANDYYDLKYEVNGYCVEQGSNLPPHLAPRGVRCTHSGAPFPDAVTEAFHSLEGPQPLPVQDGQWLRQLIRCRARARAKQGFSTSSRSRRGNIMQEYDPLTTVLVRGTGETIETRTQTGETAPSTSLSFASPASQAGAFLTRQDSGEPRRTSNSGRLLSTNYRWRDYSDMLQEEGAYDEDSDDDSFQPAARSRSARSTSQFGSDEESEDEMDLDFRSPQRRTAPRQPAARRNIVEQPRPSRSSSRRRRVERYEEPDSDDDAEFVSTNNDPSGPYVEDYSRFFFRLPTNGPEIDRQWLGRLSSAAGYSGKKIYAPQVGDKCIYIPRAHFRTIEAFPSLKSPWQHWPSGAEWPVVCCYIRDVRYRFPYIDYYGNRNANRNKCNSVVAILTLEVSGIPVLSQDRDFNWPDPTFIPPARSHVFELDMFKNDEDEFLIPIDRYVVNLQRLEEAIISKHGTTEGIEIGAYYENDDSGGDEEMELFCGQLDEYAQKDHAFNNENMIGSGFESIRIRWPPPVNNQVDTLSPWDTIVEKPKSKKYSFDRPCLDDEDKERARKAVKKLQRIPSVREQLMKPVDERRYVDYSYRVEVPMYLEMVEARLDADYYSNRFSIVADVKLIRDNCIKYNGEIGLLQDEARQMYDEFEKDMLDEQERQLNDLKTTIAASPIREIRSARSSLENLPPPAEEGGNRRRSLRIRIDATHVQAEAAAHGRATRSNSQLAAAPVAHSTAFANALQNTSRRRQSRRRSNGSDSLGHETRPQRGRTGGIPQPQVAPAAEPARRRSSRFQESPSDSFADDVGMATNSLARESAQRTTAETPAVSRQTRARRTPASAEPASGSESDAKPPARPTRHSARLDYADRKEESPSESDSDPEPRRPSRARAASESPPINRKRKAQEDSEEVSQGSSEENGNESESHAGSVSDVDAPSPAVASSPPRQRRASTRGSSSPPQQRRASARGSASPQRRASTRGVSYVENSESEFEEPPSEEDISEDEDMSPRNRSRGAVKPKAATRKRPAKKKAKKSKPRKRKREESESELSDLEETTVMSTPRTNRSRTRRKVWNEIGQKQITEVTNGMLSYLRSMDEDKLFEVPVFEAFPEIKHQYQQVVSKPMDFRTIEEERIHYYTSITELQDDLILVFSNCILFNGQMSEYGQFAQEMLNMLDDAYQDIVSDL